MSESERKSKMKVVVRSSGPPSSDTTPSGGAERRRDGRVEMSGSVNVVYDTFREFISANAANVSRGGMFIPTTEIKPVGSRLSFVLSLKDEFTLVRGRGEVVWTREVEGPSGAPAGIAVRFLDIDDTSLELIGRMTRQHEKEGGVPFSIDSSPAVAARQEAPPAAQVEMPDAAPAVEVQQDAASRMQHDPTPTPGDPSPQEEPRATPAAAEPSHLEEPGGAGVLEDSGGLEEVDPAATVLASRTPAFSDQGTVMATRREELPPVEPEPAPGMGEFTLPPVEPAGEAPEPEGPSEEWDEVWTYGDEGGRNVRPRGRRSRLLLLIGLLVVVGGGAGAYLMGLIDLPGLPGRGEQTTLTGVPEERSVEGREEGPAAGDGTVGSSAEESAASSELEPEAIEETTGISDAELADAAGPGSGDGMPSVDEPAVVEQGREPAGAAETAMEAVEPAAHRSAGTAVERVSWREDADATLVTVEVNGFVAADRVFTSQLDAPPRQLIRLVGIEAAPDEHVLEVGGPRLERIRSWLHGERRPPELHIVLDLSDDRAVVSEPVITGSRVEFLIGGPSSR